jgi:hypothetical protein
MRMRAEILKPPREEGGSTRDEMRFGGASGSRRIPNALSLMVIPRNARQICTKRVGDNAFHLLSTARTEPRPPDQSDFLRQRYT